MTRERPADVVYEGSVWWPLRLDELDVECAALIRALEHLMLSAHQEAWSARDNIKQWVGWKKVVDPAARYANHYIDATPEYDAAHQLELRIIEEMAQTRYDQLKELLEAAYAA